MCRAGPSWAGRWANKVKTIPRVCGLRNTAVMAEPEGMRCFQWKSWGQWESRKKLSVEKDKWSAERSWEAISQNNVFGAKETASQFQLQCVDILITMHIFTRGVASDNGYHLLTSTSWDPSLLFPAIFPFYLHDVCAASILITSVGWWET